MSKKRGATSEKDAVSFCTRKKDGCMKKVCSYCGKIHEKKYICPEKKRSIKARQAGAEEDLAYRFRSSGAWKKKTGQIKERDRYLCQACIRQMKGTERRYNTHALSVHHITGIREDYDRRLEDTNLITLCRQHHDMAERGELSAGALRRAAKEQSSGGIRTG